MHYIHIGLRIHALVHLLTYLHSWLGVYETGNISETVEDRATVTINGHYNKVFIMITGQYARCRHHVVNVSEIAYVRYRTNALQ